MKGFEVIFIAPRSRRHEGEPVLDKIVALAHAQDITRHTLRDDAGGVGVNGHAHSAHFFEATDEPQELMFVLDGGEADSLLRAVEDADIEVFCVRRAIDYWQLGERN
ncbi:hypothetical protein [Salinisphaera japonica]|uniref:DUF190 domain-containing protein n=1 Tax=Salinisphaera japonica YTM-1 TaxID=1209778 RepID=A0A423PI62_9GAMM|nr:hypothetical protein [Salinisphaera japonica]ROO25245.1 hypothetical protein SAJA_13285 [Salinisphaera japonica YTM-1]